jgi:precorrin-2/cobalt-factor-2 C20-methyltransferase
VLEKGEDACFITLGDALLYSTYIYMLRAIRETLPNVKVVTVPGISAFSAAAALTEFPLGKAKEPITIVPVSDDLEVVRSAVSKPGSVVLMKVGKRLQRVIDLLEEEGRLNDAVFVSRAGMASQRIETDLRRLRGTEVETGHLSIILVQTSPEAV